MGTVGSATPSGLTPNTRSEAEAALALNTIRQTDSAAPTTPLPASSNENTSTGLDDDEAKRSYRRTPAVHGPSSANYAAALAAAQAETSASSDLSTNTVEQQPTPTQSPFPSSVTSLPIGRGVVPLHTGIGSGQAEVVKRARPTGLSLGDLGRKQSWSQQDLKHIVNAELMSRVEGDAGYGSGVEGKEDAV